MFLLFFMKNCLNFYVLFMFSWLALVVGAFCYQPQTIVRLLQNIDAQKMYTKD